ncbi:hypothetical protein ABIE78_003994 [Sinorhizobium fredii]|nr:hypothetical protein CO676_28990 [Sinorhizobium sp. BJ1]
MPEGLVTLPLAQHNDLLGLAGPDMHRIVIIPLKAVFAQPAKSARYHHGTQGTGGNRNRAGVRQIVVQARDDDFARCVKSANDDMVRIFETYFRLVLVQFDDKSDAVLRAVIAMRLCSPTSSRAPRSPAVQFTARSEPLNASATRN